MELTIDDFNRYLKIYNADIDWRPHLVQLRKQLENRSKDPIMARATAREHAAFTIIYPSIDKTALVDPPHKALFYAAKHDALGTREWYNELVQIMEEDLQMKEVRDELVAQGTVDPIYYVPRWRQACLRLLDEAQDSGVESSPQVQRLFENLVKYYGGTIINALFVPQYQRQIDKIPNWRTPYFFERLIHKTYKKAELLKIRGLDIQEIQYEMGVNVKATKVSTESNRIASDEDF